MEKVLTYLVIVCVIIACLVSFVYVVCDEDDED